MFHEAGVDRCVLADRLRPRVPRCDFGELGDRLCWYVRALVKAGDISERGLAREVGCSQAHLHNVLKGARSLSWTLGDAILRRFHLSLFDLFSPAELELLEALRASRNSAA
jgi:hypothetical protein